MKKKTNIATSIRADFICTRIGAATRPPKKRGIEVLRDMNGTVRRRLGQKWRMKSPIGNRVPKVGDFLKMRHRLSVGQSIVQSLLALHWSSGFNLALSVPVKSLRNVEQLSTQRFFKPGKSSRQEQATHLRFQKLLGETGRARQAGFRSASTVTVATLVASVEPYRPAPWYRTDLQRMTVAMPTLPKNVTTIGPTIQRAVLPVINSAIKYTNPSCRTPIRHPGKSGFGGGSRHHLFGVSICRVNIYHEHHRQLGSRSDILSRSRERQRIRKREQGRTEVYSATLPNPTPVSTTEAGFIQRQTFSKMGMRHRETLCRPHCQVHAPSIVKTDARQTLTTIKVLRNPDGEKAAISSISSKYLFATLIADTPARFRGRMKNRLAKGYFEKRRKSEVFKRGLVETSHEKRIILLHGEKQSRPRSDVSTTRAVLSRMTHEKRQALVPKARPRSVTKRADRHPVQQDVSFVHKHDTSTLLAAKEMMQTLTPTYQAETTTTRSEAEVTSLVDKALRSWQMQMLNPKRLARQAERSLARQLLKERERVGR